MGISLNLEEIFCVVLFSLLLSGYHHVPVLLLSLANQYPAIFCNGSPERVLKRFLFFIQDNNWSCRIHPESLHAKKEIMKLVRKDI